MSQIAFGYQGDGLSSEPFLVTDYGNVAISSKTIAAMDAQFPGWRSYPLRGRSKAIRAYNERARRGEELLSDVGCAIAKLAFVAGQELESI